MKKNWIMGMLLGKQISNLPEPPKFKNKTPLSNNNLKQHKNPLPDKFIGKVLISIIPNNFYSERLYIPLYNNGEYCVTYDNNLKWSFVDNEQESISENKLKPLKNVLKKSKPVFEQIKTVEGSKEKTIDILYQLPNKNYIVKIHDEKYASTSNIHIRGNEDINEKYKQAKKEKNVKKIDKNSVSLSDVYKDLTNIKSADNDIEKPENIIEIIKAQIEKEKNKLTRNDFSKDEVSNNIKVLGEALDHYNSKFANTSVENNNSDELVV